MTIPSNTSASAGTGAPADSVLTDRPIVDEIIDLIDDFLGIQAVQRTLGIPKQGAADVLVAVRDGAIKANALLKSYVHSLSVNGGPSTHWQLACLTRHARSRCGRFSRWEKRHD